MTSPFSFLQTEWPDVFEAAARAGLVVHRDPRTACFYARRALELAVAWVYKHDAALALPYQENLSALIHEPSFKQTAGEAVFNKARVINTLGNRAVHGQRAIPVDDAVAAVRELFHVSYWLAHTYARKERPAPGLTFDPNALPKPGPGPKQTAEQLRQLEASLRESDDKLAAALADNAALDDELKRLRAEVAAAKLAATIQPDTHDYSESETRDYFIDLLLKEAGWALDQARDREFEVTGMPNRENKGFVDYVLWGDDGDAQHSARRGSLRERSRPQGAGGHGNWRGQNAHGDRTLRPADAMQLGQARPVSRRPRGAREPGRERVQAPSARRVTCEPRHGEGHRGPRLRIDLYESPFTDISPRGPDGLFNSTQMDELLKMLDNVRTTAIAA